MEARNSDVAPLSPTMITNFAQRSTAMRALADASIPAADKVSTRRVRRSLAGASGSPAMIGKGAAMCHHPRRLDHRRDLRHATNQSVAAKDRAEQIECVDSALEDELHHVRSHHRNDLTRRCLRVPELQGEEDQIDGTQVDGPVACPDWDAVLVFRTAHAQAVFPDRGEMPASG
jgi:hypothetical protein